jgi:hypothetical protein
MFIKIQWPRVSPILDSVHEFSTCKQQFLHRAAIPNLEHGFEMIASFYANIT